MYFYIQTHPQTFLTEAGALYSLGGRISQMSIKDFIIPRGHDLFQLILLQCLTHYYETSILRAPRFFLNSKKNAGIIACAYKVCRFDSTISRFDSTISICEFFWNQG